MRARRLDRLIHGSSETCCYCRNPGLGAWIRERAWNVLMRLSTVAPAFLLDMALVVENCADCRAAVTGPGCCVWRFRVSWHARVMEGRTGAIDIGILKTFASDARAGDKDRIVVGIFGVGGVVWDQCDEFHGG